MVSVIVPVYNVEKYLNKCVDSIINQTYKDLEIILVDDGSKDTSGEICDEYPDKDCRIKVIHKENGGLSSARNTGIDFSTGEILMFVDSDDYIDPRMVEILYKNMKTHSADISMCDFYMLYENDKIEKCEDPACYVFCGEEILNNLEDNAFCYAVVVNKLYKREIFNNLRYPIGKLHEDEYMVHRVMYNCQKLVFTKTKLYYYIKRDDSITGKFTSKRFNDLMDAFYDRIFFYKEKGLKDLYLKEVEAYIYRYMRFCQQYGTEIKGIKRKEKRIYRQALDVFRIANNHSLYTTRKKMYLSLWLRCEWLAKKVFTVNDNFSKLKR